MNFNIDSFFNLFLIVSAIHGFLFGAVVLFSKKGKEKSIYNLTLLVLVLSLSNLQTWGLKPFLEEVPFLNYIHWPWHFLIAPYLYTFLVNYLKISEKNFSIFKIMRPLFLLLIATRICSYWYLESQQIENLHFVFKKYSSFEEIVSMLFSVSIFIYSFLVFKKNKPLLFNLMSLDNLKWIQTFFNLAAITYFFWIIALLQTVFINDFAFKASYHPLKIFTTILIYWLGYQGVIRFKLRRERMEIREILNAKTLKEEPNLSKESENSTDAKELQFEKIKQIIFSKKLFTNPNLTLESLAKEMEMSASSLSRLVNMYAQKSFSDFINEFRVEQAKKILIHPDYKNYTVVAIGLESGFNSKSTFYTAFKKITGCTPVAFKKA